MHRSTNKSELGIKAHSVKWEGILTPEEWLCTQPIEEQTKEFQENGCLVVNNLIGEKELEIYKDLYQQFLCGKIDASSHRHDLGNHVPEQQKNTENVCQIMWPSAYVENLDRGPIHQRAEALVRAIMGKDMAFDFDMLICKYPYTNTTTPWHQDVSYWPDLPDKRAVSVWTALDEATVDNGCMWFIPGSHKIPMRKHRPVAEGKHIMCCDADESEGTPRPISAGSCTLHHGQTLHYTRGNSTNTIRRAFITNFRPEAMVKLERSMNIDHGLSNMGDSLKNQKQTKLTGS